MGTVAISINLRNRAITQYHDFPNGGMAVFDKTFYVADPLGIYTFGYEFITDNGNQISAYAEFAATNMGIANAKAARSHHMSYYADGDLLLTWYANESSERAEEVTHGSDNSVYQDEKIKGNRKVEGTFFNYRLDNVNGSDFTVEALRVVPIIKNLGKNK